MDDSEFAKGWKRTRSRGFARFVVTRGASWGASLAVFVLVGEWFNRGGCVFAPLAWHQREDRYKRFIEASPSE
jgi:hypothetical protein